MLILNVAGDHVERMLNCQFSFLVLCFLMYILCGIICCCLGQDFLVKEILNLDGIISW